MQTVQEQIWVRNLETNKNIIRKEKLALRKGLNSVERADFSRVISEKLSLIDEYNQSEFVLIYANYNNEVDTDEIVLRSIMRGKKVYMPKVFGDDMEFYRVFSLDELQKGAFGIREPYGIEHQKFEGNENSVCIMPLAAFDEQGNRIGYGKGYYDRYLNRIKVGCRIGLAYSCQKAECIPNEEHDIKMDYIICEDILYKTGR